MSTLIHRRDFLAASGSAAVFSVWPGAWRPSARALRALAARTILFQGDSITDAGRNRSVTEPNHADGLGFGYPLLIASSLLGAHPERDVRCFNRGVSGNTVPDLANRWSNDTVALKPDLLSILIGVNDYWHTLNGSYHGTVQDYETEYAALLERTKAALPEVRVVVLEPFVLRTGVVTDAWFPEFDRRREAAKRVAERVGATFIALHGLFERLSRQAPPSYWAADGVHPTVAGHGAIAQLWLETVTG
ncbi:MAG TPA: SGNH/GDSL hydrolase family protein [Gemmatimonadales bacterium]|nr:SGNH/GDSL hydrolase family protein [Gemmatimonadales bacterium]